MLIVRELFRTRFFQSVASGRVCCIILLFSGLMLAGCSSNKQASSDPLGNFLARHKSGRQVPTDIQHPLAKQAMTQLGIRYRWGGSSPETGFDCSGLVLYSAQQSLSLRLPPRSDDIARFGISVPPQDVQVGDLVFFNTMGTPYSHVGVYIGNDFFVHAPTTGGVVRVEDMTLSYWKKRYTEARRLDIPPLAQR